MKKLFASLLFIALTPLFAFCAKDNGFVIKGTIQGLETGTVTLAYRNEDGEDTTITAHVNSGKFILTGRVPEPELARFTIVEGWPYSLSFFLENAAINFSLVKNAPEKTQITGSSSNTVYERLQPQQLEFFDQARKYDAAYERAKWDHNKLLIKSTDSAWVLQQQKWISAIRSTIVSDKKNYTALYFIQWLLFHPGNFDTIISLFMKLDPVVRNGFAGKSFQAAYEHAHKTSPGQPAPEITGKDTSGRPVTLASLRGHLVLLDFWASYCGPCRQENPRLKALYDKYHASGFDILSFSLDDVRAPWVNAIRHDNLTWPQASDLRGGAGASAGTYNVTDLPHNYLIDRKGNILAKDLHGQDLTDALEELLRK
jgi:glutathione peroxidase-family protein